MIQLLKTTLTMAAWGYHQSAWTATTATASSSTSELHSQCYRDSAARYEVLLPYPRAARYRVWTPTNANEWSTEDDEDNGASGGPDEDAASATTHGDVPTRPTLARSQH